MQCKHRKLSNKFHLHQVQIKELVNINKSISRFKAVNNHINMNKKLHLQVEVVRLIF